MELVEFNVDINKYISSGILELYILQQLSEQERIQVEEMISKYPELKAELEAIEESIEEIAQSVAIEAPASLKMRVLESIRNKETNTNAAGKSKSTSGSNGGMFFWLIAVFAVLATALAFYNFNENQTLQAELSELNVALSTNLESLNDLQTSLEACDARLNILADPNYQPILLASTGYIEGAMARVLYNAETNDVYIQAEHLPDLPPENQYQLWAIVDGTPVDLGLLATDLPGRQWMQAAEVENPQAFAVTVEPLGGLPTPTLDNLTAIGQL